MDKHVCGGFENGLRTFRTDRRMSGTSPSSKVAFRTLLTSSLNIETVANRAWTTLAASPAENPATPRARSSAAGSGYVALTQR
jgi:hypothetical protein